MGDGADGADGADERRTKACPDCAEQVLLAARRCRHCGYRFDEPEEMAANRPADSWLTWMRRTPRRSTIPVYLAQTGVMLDDDEDPVGMWLGRVNDRDSYIIVTTIRLFITDLKLRQGRPSLVGEHLLSGVGRVDVARRLLRSTLVIEWRPSVRMVITKLPRRDVRALSAALRPGGRPGDPLASTPPSGDGPC
jgi:Uncharacterised protein family UPF0547